MKRNKENINYISFVAKGLKEGLLPFDRSGIAAIIETGSRKVDHQDKLTCQFGKLKDLVIESDYVAREKGSKSVRDHIEEAIIQQEWSQSYTRTPE